MLKITIEIQPFGFEIGKKILFEGKIWNDVTGSVQYGNYKYEFQNEKFQKFSGEVKKFNRSRPAEDLVSVVLKDISRKRNGRSSKV